MSKVRLFLLVAVLGALVPATATAQSSCSNIACVALALKSNPVYVDAKANPTVTSAEAEAIKGRSLSSGPPVFIVILPDAAAKANGGYDNLPTAVGKALGIPGAVGVVAGTHFRAGSSGIGLNAGVAESLATQAFQAHPPQQNLTPMLVDFIDRVHGAPKNQPGARATVAPPKKSNTGKIVLWTLVAIVLLVLLVIGGVVVSRRSKAKRALAARRAMLTSKVKSQGEALYNLENSGTALNDRAKAELTRAWSFYRAAEGDLSAGDLDACESELVQSRQHMDRAEQIGDSPEPVPVAPDEDVVVPFRPRKKAAAGRDEVQDVKVNPSGQVVINNTVMSPQQSRQPGYDNYFPGGMMGGRYMGPGWYGMSWWDYVILDEMMEDRREDRYERGRDRDDRDDSRGNGNGNGGDWQSTDQGQSGDWQTAGGGGGGDWDAPSSPEPERVSSPAPSYDPPSYDPPDTGGGDWGGGGGGDSGGGGGDSGGGDW